MGVKTIFKLNEDKEFDDAQEKLLFLNFDSDDRRVKLWPLPEIFRGEYTDSIVFIAVDIMQELKRGSVHVHCVHGTDRTGLVCAAFMLLQGASIESVMKYRADFGVNEFRDLIDYQDHPVIQEINRRVQGGSLPPKGVDRP